jgi:uncharacterized membrane protein YjgN (DUF898 family)
MWRGVRFWMTGSGVNYAFRSSLWMILVIVTLGIAYPWRAAAIERYKMRHTRFGDLAGSFVGSGGEFFREAGWVWLIFFCPIIALVLGLLAASGAVGPSTKTTLIVLAVCFGLPLPTLPFLWPVFRAIEWRWWANGLRIGDVRVSSDLGRSEILKLYLKFLLFSFVIAGIGGTIIAAGIAIFAKGKFVALGEFGAVPSMVEIGSGAALMIVYLLTFLAVGVVQRFYLQHDLWRVVAQSLRLDHLETAANVVNEGTPVGALGEGLADSLDVAGF